MYIKNVHVFQKKSWELKKSSVQLKTKLGDILEKSSNISKNMFTAFLKIFKQCKKYSLSLKKFYVTKKYFNVHLKKK